MHFSSVKLRDFRNIPEGRVEFSSRLNIFLGDNGQGKTNLLEALYVLSQGESFRFGDNSTLIRYDRPFAFLEGKIHRGELDYTLRAEILKSRKSFFLNEKKVSLPEIRRLFPTVLFSPESLAAIKEGADLRRALVDDFLVTHHPSNADLISEYRKALKTRNRVLKDWLEEKSPKNRVVEVLESLNPSFFRLATRMTSARLKALIDIQSDFELCLRRISKSSVDISVDYLISSRSALQMTPEEVDNALRQRAFELREAELSSGVSLIGPHKHDIVFLYNQKDSRFFSSQGQQRAIILAFKMAQIVYHGRVHGLYPALMLDDVLSELDSVKRNELISFLHEIKTQVFLTTTDLHLPEHFALDRPSVIEMTNGQISVARQ
ncbi:MAG TPA: DNA replication and repair protein RecF [Pseudobdellovibrionaceae bacterium]|nr:DNA replication and repair protein RecF [Pseudobdellovibrionaceae bacterium]